MRTLTAREAEVFFYTGSPLGVIAYKCWQAAKAASLMEKI